MISVFARNELRHDDRDPSITKVARIVGESSLIVVTVVLLTRPVLWLMIFMTFTIIVAGTTFLVTCNKRKWFAELSLPRLLYAVIAGTLVVGFLNMLVGLLQL